MSSLALFCCLSETTTKINIFIMMWMKVYGNEYKEIMYLVLGLSKQCSGVFPRTFANQFWFGLVFFV